MECLLYGSFIEKGIKIKEKKNKPKIASKNSCFWSKCQKVKVRIFTITTNADVENKENTYKEIIIRIEISIIDIKKITKIPNNSLINVRQFIR